MAEIGGQQQFVLAPVVVRGLNDKLYEKRKAAAIEVEKLVREALVNNDHQRISSIVISLIQDFAYSAGANARNGGLIALAATSIALGSSELSRYLDDIVPPVISCFTDTDSRVRYYACEAMYNVAKVARGDILKYFNEIFDALSKLMADTDPSVKTGAELLDRLVKDIVTERSSYYPQEGELEDHPVAGDEKQLSSLSHTGEVSGTDRRYPSDPQMPPTPGSTYLLSGMKPSTFNLPRFIPLLAERIKAINPATRMFLVQWIKSLDSVPDLELIGYLPDFMDGLFAYLSDRNVDVRVAALNCLTEFLKEMQDVVAVQRERGSLNVRGRNGWLSQQSSGPLSPSATSVGGLETIDEAGRGNLSPPPFGGEVETVTDPGRALSPTDSQDQDDPNLYINRAISSLSMASTFYAQGGKIRPGKPISTVPPAGVPYISGQVVVFELGRMMGILAPHLISQDEETQSTALRWVDKFVEMFAEHMLPFTPELVGAILPCLAHTIDPIRNLAMEANANLFRLVTDAYKANEGSGAGTADLSASISSISPGVDLFDMQATVETLTLNFQDGSEETRVASMDWLIMLHRKAPRKILTSDDNAFHALLKTLSDPSEEVVRRDLQLLAQISHYSDEEYFMKFIVNLLSLFSSDRRILESRGALIIRQLCLSLNAERIYRAFAEILERDEDLEFASSMVQNLNIILITAPELSDVRRRLKNLDSRDGLVLFAVLYRSWCHNPVATFALCLLAQAYEHAANLLQIFAELEVTVSFLVQVDKLVQLIESPVFTYLRLQLLEPDRYPHLFRCLFGILMLLPQSSAFATLRNRLNSVSSMVMLYGHTGPLGGQVTGTAGSASPQPSSAKARAKPSAGHHSQEPITLRWHELLTHFRNVQLRHERSRRTGSVI
ncbi:vacuolar protein 14 C-terminal Fig4p binding-domain-containing protein [Zopfochytrium polystomum]|nr:vacuolar protein 14 C-terminal Fig4p binding-domain-containing protein [Zopfochytrium polystomum]